MKKVFFSLFAVFLLSACGMPAPQMPTVLPPSPVPQENNPAVEVEPVCIDPTPTQADIDRALSFSGMLLSGSDWERTYTVDNEKVSVTWNNPGLGSVIILDAFIYPCGYEDIDLDQLFNVDYWSIVFANYDGYQYLNECRNDAGTRLYTFSADFQGVPFDVRYWALNDSPTRVLTFMIVLPSEASAQMNEFAYAFFPQLQSCE